jgi:retron-type reverse transcriptase
LVLPCRLSFDDEEHTMSDLWKYMTKEHYIDFILSLRLLGKTDWPPERQLACLYAVSNHTEWHYTAHRTPKRDGTNRELLSPDPLLKSIQRNILHHVLDGLSVSPHATAYRKGGGILQNALPHGRQDKLLQMDIRDFFGSISYLMVYRSAFPRSLFPPGAAALLAHLCCYWDSLPQGAPTSAAISNLVMKPFYDYIGRWCADRGIAYTRYCDDMTFSGKFDARQVANKVRSFLLSMGFEVNEGKTRLRTRHQQQSVTGVVVNEKPQVSRAYRNKLRQELHYCAKYGVQSHLERMGNPNYLPVGQEQVEHYLRSLLGRIGFVLQVDPHNEVFGRTRNTARELLAAAYGK